ncbi:aminoglycoside phosphotransferase [Mycobacterium sp. 852002-51163_SCH5372311]|uniref:phosphotransferase family protein n=1 Tax=Mycobacterium sp. 852002-51163_SCH5372311 TaxID=1834097 RepID=UPI0007FD1A0A|nr:phosphotransferase family protein [Mycobacterium sp. 852002-51163_SCH5372311]OBF86083.1 aminoglycoside phosphotransferase [Mycobacterium sp. 852002-51163_SCH5372311]
MTETQGVVGVDPDAVARWLTKLGLEVETPLDFRRIGLGQSNLTYRVTDAADHAWVLRRPPLGHLLASAHDVLREARIIAALENTDVPVPRILGTTTDSEYSEAPLVLMEFVDGRVVDTMAVAEALTPQQRRQIALDLPRTLAKIHAVDLAEVGLDDLASHKPYAQRQLKRWAGQWELSKTRELPELDDLTRRLVAAAPEQSEISLVHGDFHLRNLITSPESGEVVATLDWELSTLGEPLADMGSLLTYWPEPGETTGGDFAPSTLEGFPDRAEMTRLYLEATGRDPAALQYWHVLGLWKLAIIAEGVMRRARDEPQNKAAAGTPTVAWIDARVHKATEIADAAGIGTR